MTAHGYSWLDVPRHMEVADLGQMGHLDIVGTQPENGVLEVVRLGPNQGVKTSFLAPDILPRIWGQNQGTQPVGQQGEYGGYNGTKQWR